MSKVVSMKLWRAYIEKTEEFIVKMYTKGYSLEKIQKDNFIFEESGEKDVVVKASFIGEKGKALSKGLKEDGWEILCESNGWVFLKNEGKNYSLTPLRDKISTSTETYYNEFRRIPYLMVPISIIYLLNIFIVESLIIEIIFFIFFIFSIISLMKMLKMKRILKNQATGFLNEYKENTTYAKVDFKENVEINSNRTIKNLKYWQEDTENTKFFLETMERDGKNLVGISQDEFVFEDGEKRDIEYEIDKVKYINPIYCQHNKSEGWELCGENCGVYIWRRLRGMDNKPFDKHREINMKEDGRERKTILLVLVYLLILIVSGVIIFIS